MRFVHRSLNWVFSMTEIKAIGVVGGGQMGSGIAQLAATHGHQVWLIDSDPAALAKATDSISSSIQRLVSRNLLSRVRILSVDSTALSVIGYFVSCFTLPLSYLLLGVLFCLFCRNCS